MIRLAVNGEDDIDRAVATRLRGATIATCFDASQMTVPPEPCDAVLFIGRRPPQVELIQRCLSASKHVLLATGSWLSSRLLQTLSDAARQAGVQLAVMNPDRFLPSRQLIRQQLDAGKLGDPGLVRIHHWEPTAANDRQQSAELPTLLLRDLDLTLWLFRKFPNSVYAVSSANREQPSGPGLFVQVHLGFPGGGMALIDYSDRLPDGDGYQSLTVIGSAGAAYADDQQNTQLVFRGGQPQAVKAAEGVRQLVTLVQDFADGLNANCDRSSSVSDWHRVMTLADAVQESLQSKRSVPLEDC